MENYLHKNSTFYVVPENIDNASTFMFIDTENDILKFENKSGAISISKNEKLELFSNNNNGILYFRAVVEDYDNGILKIIKSGDMEILQRRENERVIINETITLIDDNGKEISATIKDLSVGGMKIEVSEQLFIKNNYKSCLHFDNLNLNFTFVPLRISCENEEENEGFSISGQIFLTTPKDKIELIQYCYKKHFEQTNRG